MKADVQINMWNMNGDARQGVLEVLA